MRIRIPPGSDTRVLLWPEAVSGATHRQDQLRVLGIALDLLAQMPNVDVDRAGLPVVGTSA